MYSCETVGKGACITRMKLQITVQTLQWKKIKMESGRGEDMEFSEVLKKWQVDFPGVNWKQCGLFWAWSKKIYVEFPGVLVLGLKISEGCNTIMWSFLLEEALFCLEFPWGKVKNLNIFWNIPFNVNTIRTLWVALLVLATSNT